MSLRVWLPLIKDLRNQGLDDIPVFQLESSNLFVNNGKIGEKALNIIKQQRILPNTSCMTGKKQMSYAFWVKVNTVWSTQWLDGIAWYSTDGTTAAYSRQEFYNNCTKVGTWFKGSPNSLSGYDFNPEKWTHIAATFDYNIGEAKFYLNGELKGTSNGLSTSDYCRGDFYIGDTGVDILENDFRIYDHALSPLEVKQISQGLILHYPLNRNGWGGENILTNSSGYKGTDSWGGNITVNTENGIPYFIAKRIDTSSSSRTFITHSAITSLVSSWSPNSYFVISGYYRIPSSETNEVSANMFIRWTYTGSSGSYADTGFTIDNSSTQKDKWIRFEKIYQVPSSYVDGAVNFYLSAFSKGLATVHWKNVKLELGSTPTPWSPAPSDSLATTLGMNNNIEYDCSGYGNNGTKVGDFTYSSDSPRYLTSTFFEQGVNSYIITPAINFDGKGFTASYWFKSSDAGKSGYQMPLSTGGNYEMSISPDGRLRGGIYVNGTRHVYNAGTSNYLDGEWHMFTMTYNGAMICRYIDGVLEHSETISGTATTSNVFAIGRHGASNTTYGSINLYESDVRIYCTALSAEDILSLYHNSAYIDNQGNLYGAILREV